MAGTLLRQGDKPNINICEFCVDAIDEVSLLPTTTSKGTGKFSSIADFNLYAPIGSTCIVGNEGDDLLIFMLFSFGWKQVS